MFRETAIGSMLRQFALVTGCIAVTGCGSGSDGSTGASERAGDEAVASIRDVQRTLSVGMEGDDVAALYSILAARGYFPNERLASAYPAWRPLVREAPADVRVFDESMRLAVSAYQKNGGLPVTGEVDEATLVQLKGISCGVPDGMDVNDPANKFFVAGAMADTNLTWRVSNGDVEVTAAQTRTLVTTAFNKWAAESSVTAAQVTTGQEVLIFYADFGAPAVPPNPAAPINYTCNGVTYTPDPTNWAETRAGCIVLNSRNSTVTWNATAGGNLDALLSHELGHALGLGHSSVPGALMQHNVPTANVQPDDRAGISLIYDIWERADGTSSFLAEDVAVSPVGTHPMWATNAAGGVATYLGANVWSAANLPGDRQASRITIDANGSPWVAATNGDIFCRTNDNITGTWKQQPGCAANVSGSANALWAVACSASGGRRIFRWRPATFCSASPTASTAWTESNALPEEGWSFAAGTNALWAIDTWFNVYRRSSTNPTDGTPWTLMPYPGFLGAFDIAVDADNIAWTTSVWEGGVWAFNEQICQLANGTPCPNTPNTLPPGNDGAPAFFEWKQMRNGVAFAIAAGGRINTVAGGTMMGPTVLDYNNKVWRTVR